MSRRQRGPREPAEVEVDLRQPVVGVVMGSDHDLPVVQVCIDTLEEFDISYEVRILSAHRTPEQAHQYASTARLNGLKVIVAAAGDLSKEGNTWYQLIQSGMERAGAVARMFDGGQGLCLVDDSWSTLDLRSPETTQVDLPDLPSVFLRPAALPVAGS